MIIFLNGSKDAGKSTTAGLVKQKDDRIAVVEPDVFFAFLPDHLTVLEKAPYCVEMSATCARMLHANGYIVLIAYPLTDADYVRYTALLSGILPDPPLCITLAPAKEVLLERLDLLRNQSDSGRFRREVIESQYERDGAGFGVVHTNYPTEIVDNSTYTPEETADAVYAIILRAIAQNSLQQKVRV